VQSRNRKPGTALGSELLQVDGVGQTSISFQQIEVLPLLNNLLVEFESIRVGWIHRAKRTVSKARNKVPALQRIVQAHKQINIE